MNARFGASACSRARFRKARADSETLTEPRTILFCLSGHGHFDLASYDAYLSGKLQDYEHPAEAIAEAMKTLPV